MKLASLSCSTNFTPRPGIFEVHDQVPGLLHDPGLDRVPGGTEDPNAAGAKLNGSWWLIRVLCGEAEFEAC